MKSTRLGSRRSRQAFTLIETGVAVLLMSLIFMGMMRLFIDGSRMSLKASAATTASTAAANALQQVTDELREAYSVNLPSDSTFTDLYGDIGYTSTHADGTTVYTGMLVTFPPAGAAINVIDSQGTPTPLSTLVDRSSTQSGNSVLIYRGGMTADGTPGADPKHGEYLWETGRDRPIIKGISSALDAVQFYHAKDANGQDIPGSVMIKIVCGGYSRINGEQTSEATDGSKVTTLTAKLVVMRNIALGLLNAPSNVAMAPPLIPDPVVTGTTGTTGGDPGTTGTTGGDPGTTGTTGGDPGTTGTTGGDPGTTGTDGTTGTTGTDGTTGGDPGTTGTDGTTGTTGTDGTTGTTGTTGTDGTVYDMN